MGFFSSLWKGFTGEGAKETANKTRQEQTAAAGRAREGRTGAWNTFGTQARSDLGSGINAVRGIWNPVRSAPTWASDTYYNALGRGGQQAQADAGSLYWDDPNQMRVAELVNRNTERYGNARGRSFATSPGQLASARAYTEGYNRNFLDRLAPLGAEERGRIDNANAALASAESGYAGDLARTEAQKAAGVSEAYAGEGAQVGNAWGNWGQQYGQAQNALAQNVLGLIGTGIEGYNVLYNGGKKPTVNNKIG